MELLRFFPSPVAGGRPTALWITAMWPDETHTHHGNFVKSQADSLLELGLSIDVLYIRGPIRRRAYFSALPEVRRRVRDPRYDVIHAHYGHTAAVAVAAQSKPLVISFCGGDLLGLPGRNGRHTVRPLIESAVFRQLPRFAVATITKSDEMEMALPQSLRAKNEVIPNGVDLDLFRRGSRAEARATVGWDPEAKIAMFLGDPADPRKRVELAEAAMARVVERMPEAKLEVIFRTQPEEVPTYMRAADCLVFPSRSEGSPNTVKEAMAAELPIVATPVGDIPERLGGVEGCFVRPADPVAFADAMVDALGMEAAPAARAAVRPLSMDRVARRLLNLYEGLADTPSTSHIIE